MTYYLLDQMRYTPFDKQFDPAAITYFQDKDFHQTEVKSQADVLVTSSQKKAAVYLLKNPWTKNLLIWTNEPRNSSINTANFRPYPWTKKARMMSVYTGNVFVGPVTYQKSRFTKFPPLQLLPADFELKQRQVIALMSYYQGGAHTKLMVDGQNIDLIKMRSDIALKGHEMGCLDIYGRGWPEGYSKEDSRSGDWGGRKGELMNNYQFNLCFENTVYGDYITEKIWDSVQNYCLPIYYGGGNSEIYKLFEKDSFIDYSQIQDPVALFELIQSMDSRQYAQRLNSCIAVYNSLVEKPNEFWEDIRAQQLDNILEAVRGMIK